MIEVYSKDKKIIKVHSISEIESKDNLISLKVLDSSLLEVKKICTKYNLESTIFQQEKDIEISSHYLKSPSQISFNLIIPNYNSSGNLSEEAIVIIIKNEVVFYFLSSNFDNNISGLTKTTYHKASENFTNYLDHFSFQIGVLSDYHADLTEIVASEIISIYENLIKTKSFERDNLDLILKLNFNNHKIKASITNFRKILKLLTRSKFEKKLLQNQLKLELADISVITDHIHYNFERLDDLKENISSKIDLEQNRIFKLLTIMTVCISLPTLIAGVYGMNFLNMPELKWRYGFYYAVGLMIVSFLIGLCFFKYKKWIR